ncbi:hypothetical protein [Thiolinea disciformis]|uniref:hypothetical protein n=1 Tax=Thiolinea disciformis TaxID=125614 RepID=UPI0003697763|nr:hypothetical protein [Thiolinea disciformis]
MAALLALKQAENFDNYNHILLADRFQPNTLQSSTALAEFYWGQDLKTLNADGSSNEVFIVLIHKHLTQTHEHTLVFQRVLNEFHQREDLSLSVLEYGRYQGQFWYVLPSLEGEFLSEKIKRVGRNGLSLTETFDITEQIITELKHTPLKQAYGYLEAGAVFCQAKQCHLLSTPIASALSLITSVKRNTIGSFTLQSSFISPDAAMGEAASSAADTFSIAAIIYYMLNGHLPFVLESSLEAAYKQIIPATVLKLEPEHWEHLKRALSFKKEERHTTPEELLYQLQQLIINKQRFSRTTILLTSLVISVLTGYAAYQAFKPASRTEAVENQASSIAPNSTMSTANTLEQSMLINAKALEQQAVTTTNPAIPDQVISNSPLNTIPTVVGDAIANPPSKLMLEDQTPPPNNELLAQQQQWAAELEKQRLEAEQKQRDLEAKNKALAEAEKQKLALEKQLQLLSTANTPEPMPSNSSSRENNTNTAPPPSLVVPQAPITRPQSDASIPKPLNSSDNIVQVSVGQAQANRTITASVQRPSNNPAITHNSQTAMLTPKAENIEPAKKQSESPIRPSYPPPRAIETRQASNSVTEPQQEMARLIYKTVAGQARFPNPRLFGPIAPEEQADADRSCRQLGAINAIGYHPRAINLEGKPFSSYYCHFSDAPTDEIDLIGSQPSATSPRLTQRKLLAWDKPHLFGPIPANLQTVGNNICQKAGFRFATEYYPYALDEKGRPMPQGGYICDN